jgi:hypothetical protein
VWRHTGLAGGRGGRASYGAQRRVSMQRGQAAVVISGNTKVLAFHRDITAFVDPGFRTGVLIVALIRALPRYKSLPFRITECVCHLRGLGVKERGILPMSALPLEYYGVAISLWISARSVTTLPKEALRAPYGDRPGAGELLQHYWAIDLNPRIASRVENP